MVSTAILGFPRIGAQRELKKSLESYWKGERDVAALAATARAVRAGNWRRMQDAGLTHIPSNDFSLYDQVLDHVHLFGAIPKRYDALKTKDALSVYFAMARGHQAEGIDVVAMEMTKWFDTNYHYLVPEFSGDTQFVLTTRKPIEEFLEAKALGIHTRPVLIGPVSFLLLGKRRDGGQVLDLLPKLLPVYNELLAELKKAGADWIQIDEPFLALDLTPVQRDTYKTAYDALKPNGLKLALTTYFDGLRDNAKLAFSLPVQGVHIDLVRAPDQLQEVLNLVQPTQTLSLGLVNGRNIWKTDFVPALTQISEAVKVLTSDRVIVATSCSLLHCPVDLAFETKLDTEIKQWLAFAVQKLEEVALLAVGDTSATKKQFAANAAAIESRKASPRIHNAAVQKRLAAISASMLKRQSPYPKRVAAQRSLQLPLFATTTIGSFPQTQQVRDARASFKAGRISAKEYESFLEQETKDCIQFQLDAGIDVPVHGEFERNDMVEYFGEQLEGFTFSSNGWVQSYGSRAVKPPIIFGDVWRKQPMTVRWSKYAQSLTDKPVKGMLTGPVTILQWSFVRDDQPREATTKQIALSIRDEVVDLEAAGIRLIQIDEPAVREGLPLRHADHAAYLKWAVDAFRLSAAGVADATQIHTHMCYCEFNDIMDSIAALDADVISIETSRSAMELLTTFRDFKYPNQVGPGVYDIHSPRVPRQEEMVSLLRKACEVLEPEQIWVNPDCGLKTRGWKEVDPALRAMVAAARQLRAEVGQGQTGETRAQA